MYQRGEISEEQFTFYKHHACPSCGACSFMGTASTMQIMAEALGLMLPGSALMPATCGDLCRRWQKKPGPRAAQMAVEGVTARQMVTAESFENAVLVHAAISGIYQHPCCTCPPSRRSSGWSWTATPSTGCTGGPTTS